MRANGVFPMIHWFLTMSFYGRNHLAGVIDYSHGKHGLHLKIQLHYRTKTRRNGNLTQHKMELVWAI